MLQILYSDIFLFYSQQDVDAGTSASLRCLLVFADGTCAAGKLGSMFWCEPGKRYLDTARRIRVIGAH
jgi:hypothetical protein